MLKDKFGREIYYLRVSVTDRCNLRCRYCMPEEGIDLNNHEDILRIEELKYLVGLFVDEGISSVRVTGGEPLVRKGIVDFMGSLAAMPLKDISMTTNGVLLPEMAADLKKVGLNRINISLDSLNPDRFHWITRCGHLGQVLEGIDAALAAKLDPVKINAVVTRGLNDDEVWPLAQMAKDRPLHVRFIELMPVGNEGIWSKDSYVSSAETKAKIEQMGGPLLPAHDIKGCGPAEIYHYDGWKGSIGFIHAVSAHFCQRCNRLRLTADGKLFPCLHSELAVDIKTPLRAGATDAELRRLFLQAVELKPRRSHLGEQHSCMHSIGG
jgi:cyclic pyranopterin phosphate synthase